MSKQSTEFHSTMAASPTAFHSSISMDSLDPPETMMPPSRKRGPDRRPHMPDGGGGTGWGKRGVDQGG